MIRRIPLGLAFAWRAPTWKSYYKSLKNNTRTRREKSFGMTEIRKSSNAAKDRFSKKVVGQRRFFAEPRFRNLTRGSFNQERKALSNQKLVRN